MKKVFSSLHRLKQLRETDPVSDIRAMIQQWIDDPVRAMGTAKVTAEDRRVIREECDWAFAWLDGLERAIERQETKAAVHFTAGIYVLLAGLNNHFNLGGSINRLHDFAKPAFARETAQKIRKAKAAKQNTKIKKAVEKMLRSDQYRNGFLQLTKPKGTCVYDVIAKRFDVKRRTVERAHQS